MGAKICASDGWGMGYRETKMMGMCVSSNKREISWINTNLGSWRSFLHPSSLGFLHVVVHTSWNQGATKNTAGEISCEGEIFWN